MSQLQLAFSDEAKERIAKLMAWTRTTLHYGFIPYVLYLGWSITPTRPPLVALLTPFPST